MKYTEMRKLSTTELKALYTTTTDAKIQGRIISVMSHKTSAKSFQAWFNSVRGPEAAAPAEVEAPKYEYDGEEEVIVLTDEE